MGRIPTLIPLGLLGIGPYPTKDELDSDNVECAQFWKVPILMEFCWLMGSEGDAFLCWMLLERRKFH